ncbi:MAG TPA: bile acid:sodium symporter family protein [Pseudonocardiaceae bacterium]|nr:bile acid:sodium symporter family protein [Pseudonocardiaceae bacterium]
MARLRLDPFIASIVGAAALAVVLPVRGVGATAANDATTVAIGLLFFLYGARLSTAETVAGLRHWRLQLAVLVASFVMFPLLGLTARLLVPTVLTPALYAGVLLLCTLPSTVQSSIVFTSIAKGNVAAAICAASLSSLVGIVITPLLIGLLVSGGGAGLSAGSITDIVLRLLAPFLAGQLARRWIGGWITAHQRPLRVVDRGSILLVVYTAFSAGVAAGIWHQLTVPRLAAVVVVNLALLGLALAITSVSARLLGFDRADRITIVFCGSKKSLAAGLPMASVLFAGAGSGAVGLIVLPLMLFHQIQLMACAALARRWARQAAREGAPEAGPEMKPVSELAAGRPGSP